VVVVEPGGAMRPVGYGGYRVVNIYRATDTVASVAAKLAAVDGWGNASRLAGALSQYAYTYI